MTEKLFKPSRQEIQSLVTELKKIDGIVINEPIDLASGQTSNYYIDIKKAYGYPRILRLMAESLTTLIPYNVNCLASSGYGGIPLASVITAKYNYKLSLIRETPKNHGTKALIDGYIPNPDDEVALIDDVFTTGGSLRKMKQVLGEDVNVVGYFVVVKRGDGDLDRPLFYLITPEDLIS